MTGLFSPFGVRRCRLALLGALSFLFLASVGCTALFSPGDPPVRLHFAPVFPQMHLGNAKTRTQQLVVAFPSTSMELGGDAIILLLRGRELQRLAGYRWSNSIPALVQRSVIHSLNASGAFAAVADEASGLTARVRVMCELEQFTLRYADTMDPDKENTVPPVAVMQATFRLVDLGLGKTLGTLPVHVEHTATGTDVNALAAACETAVVKMMDEATPWVVKQLEK